MDVDPCSACCSALTCLRLRLSPLDSATQNRGLFTPGRREPPRGDIRARNTVCDRCTRASCCLSDTAATSLPSERVPRALVTLCCARHYQQKPSCSGALERSVLKPMLVREPRVLITSRVCPTSWKGPPLGNFRQVVREAA